jgi:hypothetical protein
MFKEAQPCTQHATVPESTEGKKGVVDAYLPRDLVQNGNTKQVVNLLSSMNDNISQDVNTLCNEPLPFTDPSTEQVEHTNMAMNSTVIPMHCTVSHGKISGAKNLAPKFQIGNSSMNLNQELHDEDQASICAHAMIMSHEDPEGMKEIGEEQILEKAKQGEESGTPCSTPVKRRKRREGSVDEDSNTRAQRLKAIKNLDAPGTSESKSF